MADIPDAAWAALSAIIIAIIGMISAIRVARLQHSREPQAAKAQARTTDALLHEIIDEIATLHIRTARIEALLTRWREWTAHKPEDDENA